MIDRLSEDKLTNHTSSALCLSNSFDMPHSVEASDPWLQVTTSTSENDCHNITSTCSLLSTPSSWEPLYLEAQPGDNLSFDFGELLMLPGANSGISHADFMRPTIEKTTPHVSSAHRATSDTTYDNPSLISREVCRSNNSPSSCERSIPSSHHTRGCTTTQHSQRKESAERPIWSDTPSSQESEEERLLERRRRNKYAAQRLRQRKADQISDLESRLDEVAKERDDLRLRLAKWEGEAMALRKLLETKMG